MNTDELRIRIDNAIGRIATGGSLVKAPFAMKPPVSDKSWLIFIARYADAVHCTMTKKGCALVVNPALATEGIVTKLPCTPGQFLLSWWPAGLGLDGAESGPIPTALIYGS